MIAKVCQGVFTVQGMDVAMVGMGWESAFSVTASDGRDVFRDDHFGQCWDWGVVSYGQS